jgi:hypothetical protein
MSLEAIKLLLLLHSQLFLDTKQVQNTLSV